MAAKKKSSGSSTPKKKASVKKKAAPKKKAAAKKKAPPKKKKAAAKKKSTRKKPDRPKGSASSMDITRGHIFAIRPRVNTGFRQHDLLEAKRSLNDEVFSNIGEAARAVAEEALRLTRDIAARPEKHKRR